MNLLFSLYFVFNMFGLTFCTEQPRDKKQEFNRVSFFTKTILSFYPSFIITCNWWLFCWTIWLCQIIYIYWCCSQSLKLLTVLTYQYRNETKGKIQEIKVAYWHINCFLKNNLPWSINHQFNYYLLANTLVTNLGNLNGNVNEAFSV